MVRSILPGCTISAPTTRSSGFNRIPLTPLPVRPMGRASFSEKRMENPFSVANKISLFPSHNSAPINRSPLSIVRPITPPCLGLLYAIKEVFFTMPRSVAIITNLSSSNSRTDKILAMDSPDCKFTKLAIDFPFAVRLTSGMENTRNQ